MLNKLRQLVKPKTLASILLQLLLVLLIVTGIGYWKSRNMASGMAPVIVDQLLTGEPYDLAAFHGEPVFIYFWAPWCPICKLQDSNIESISKDYRVITIASWVENKAEVIAHMQQRHLTFPVIVDEHGAWAEAYGVKAVPAGFFLDKQGEIGFTGSGYSTEAGMRFRLWWLAK